MSELVRWIVDLNIKHYRDLLNTELERTRRRTVVQLLADEEVKLAAIARLPTENFRWNAAAEQ